MPSSMPPAGASATCQSVSSTCCRHERAGHGQRGTNIRERSRVMTKELLIEGWEAHLRSELIDKNVDATMKTMTSDPYVNHVPTMTGGVGAVQLRRFYKHHFISRQP